MPQSPARRRKSGPKFAGGEKIRRFANSQHTFLTERYGRAALSQMFAIRAARQPLTIRYVCHSNIQVASQDDDISSLREAVHTESLRADHASKMLAKYVKRAAAAADAAAGASHAPATRGGAGPTSTTAPASASPSLRSSTHGGGTPGRRIYAGLG